ncbi:hypothetical protein ICO35_004791 [Salmonella enterica]|nr:hypothetical protein [Salmonella enterica]
MASTPAFRTYAPGLHSPLPHEELSSITTPIYHIKPVYTPLALRDWFRAAPRNPLKATDAPAACPTPRRPGKNFPVGAALSGGRIGRKT